MARVNIRLKLTFIVFNWLFAIFGGVILSIALLSEVLTNVKGGENLEVRTGGLIVLYVVGSVTMVIAVLGAYGAKNERKDCLIAYLVCMIVGSLLMLPAGISFARVRPKLEGLVEAEFRELLPLDKASYGVRAKLEGMQRLLQCCGPFSYDDWKGNIPDSCVCDQIEETEGKCQTVDVRMIPIPQSKSKSIYTKSCFSIVLYYVKLIANIVKGFCFALASLVLLGMVLSSVIIHQMRDPDRPSVLWSAPAIFTTQPRKYQGGAYGLMY